MKNTLKRLLQSCSPLIVLVLVFSAAHAQANVSASYKSENEIQAGTIVILQSEADRTVQPAPSSAEKLFGVVTSVSDNSIRLQNQDDNLFVTTLGQAEAFVTDANGPIKAGDQLSISPITGVAQRAATDKASIGTALQDFAGTEDARSRKTIELEDGTTREVALGKIQIQVQPEGSASLLPAFVTRLGESLAGKPVSTTKIVGAIILILVSTIVSVALLLGAIRTALVSIGRNPLSKKAVYRSLLQVTILVIVVFAVGILSAYGVIRV